MKILDVAEFYTDEGGGVKTYINQKLKAGSRLGHEIVIVAPGRFDGDEQRFGGKIIWIKGPPLIFDPRYIILWKEKRVHEIIEREKPDLIEGSSPWTGGHFAGNWKGKAVKTFIFHQDPVAAYGHTFLSGFLSFKRIDSIAKFFWTYISKLSRKFDATIVSGEWLAKRIDKFGVKNAIPVPFGIDKEFFSPKKRNLELRSKMLKELGLPESAPLLISVSRYHPEKRLGTLIEGFAKATKEKPMGLLIFGDGPFRAWVKHKASDVPHLKLMGFTDNREQLAEFMASCDYFIHGSSAETYGLVVAEGICSGLPIVAPDIGGANDLAREEHAETYKTGNSDALKEALLRISERDRGEMVSACESFAENSIFTVENHFDLLFKRYQELLDQKGSKKN